MFKLIRIAAKTKLADGTEILETPLHRSDVQWHTLPPSASSHESFLIVRRQCLIASERKMNTKRNR
jgi:hypothetical protein